MTEIPRIVCLCGSTRFKDAFMGANRELTFQRKIVLMPGIFGHSEMGGQEKLGAKVIDEQNELHLRKIDLADEILVLNINGYIGNGTRNEIAYAQKTGKPVKYLEAPPTQEQTDVSETKE